MDPLEQSEEFLFQKCVELPSHERVKFLETNCPDPGLRKRVERLLQAHEMEDAFLDPASEADSESKPAFPGRISPADEKAGDQIGRYQLIERIGQGAWGTVWRAKQVEPIEREVALKILKLGLDTKEFLRRFEIEQKVLAMMSHPNIATILDAGATDVGRPYLVMELVEGKPLLDYADEHKLSIEARIRLFIRICKALHYAHGKSIIHRDIKPSNILVSGPPEDPIPKVIDFGIAKVVQPQVEAGTALTNTQVFMGTPYYCSQEQLEGRYKDVDHRSDVYSLGALLYPLISGRTYIDMDSFSDQGLELVRLQLMDMTPTRPSFSFSSLSEEEQIKITDRLSSSPRALKKKLKGDLDWIVLKCLAKDPGRRYQSTLELAEDLQAFLENRSVKASAPSLVRRTQKFIKRKRLGPVLWTGVAAMLFVVPAFMFFLEYEDRGSVYSESISHRISPAHVGSPTIQQVSYTGYAYTGVISPDGKYIAHNGVGVHYIVLHDLESGEEEYVPLADAFDGSPKLSNLRILGWSPDSEHIIGNFRADEKASTFSIPREGGKATKLAGSDIPWVVWPTVGDGVLGFYADIGKGPLVEMKADNTGAYDVKWNFDWNKEAEEFEDQTMSHISWFEAKERLLLATRNRDNNKFHVWTMDVYGEDIQHLFEFDEIVFSVVGAPDGLSVYFLHLSGQEMSISKYSLVEDGERKTLLYGNFSSMSLSNNGIIAALRRQLSSNLAFAYVDESGEWKEDEFTFGTSVHRSPTIAPDGEWVVYTRANGQTSNIFIEKPTDEFVKQLTFFTDSKNDSPSWSSDGKAIAFGSNDDGHNRVWIVEADGSDLRPIEDVRIGSNLSVSWTHDSRLLYKIPDNTTCKALLPFFS